MIDWNKLESYCLENDAALPVGDRRKLRDCGEIATANGPKRLIVIRQLNGVEHPYVYELDGTRRDGTVGLSLINPPPPKQKKTLNGAAVVILFQTVEAAKKASNKIDFFCNVTTFNNLEIEVE